MGMGLEMGLGLGLVVCYSITYATAAMKMTCSVCTAQQPPFAFRHPQTFSKFSMPGSVVNSNSTWVGKPSMTLSLPRLAQLLGSFMCFVFAVACRINGIIYNLFLPELQVLKR